MSNTLIIHNPQAGDGGFTDKLRAFAAEHQTIELIETQASGDAESLAQQACDGAVERVVAAGGDGTIHEVINGLVQASGTAPILGVLPCGSANDFAKAIGLDESWDAATRVFDSGSVRRIDTVRIAGADRGFMINAATGGLSVEVDQKMDDATKSWWGGFAYARVAASVIPEARNYEARVRTDEREIEGTCAGIIVANGGYAGNLCMAPQARIDDGQLDVMVVRAETLPQRARLLAEFALSRQTESEFVDCLVGSRVEIESDPAMPFIADGERLGETRLVFDIQTAALRVLTPARDKNGDEATDRETSTR